jgi:hypothetical protein
VSRLLPRGIAVALGSAVPFETIIVIILLLWLLGAFIVPIGTNLVHLLLVVLLVVVILRVAKGRRPLP